LVDGALSKARARPDRAALAIALRKRCSIQPALAQARCATDLSWSRIAGGGRILIPRMFRPPKM